MRRIILILSILLFSKCHTETPTSFSHEALSDTFTSLNNTKITFKEILNKHKGKKIVVDIWASWCGDCIRGLPKVKTLQENNPAPVYLFLSLDKTVDAWKDGIKKYHITNGEHYFIDNGYEGGFGSFVNIDWIPRYMVIDEFGNINLFKSINADDVKIIESLKK